MSTVTKRTVSLAPEQAAFLDAQLARGTYASASEVVRAGLRALQEREAAVEKWLNDEVAATWDRMQADPGRARAAEDVLQALRGRHDVQAKRMHSSGSSDRS